MTPAKDSEAPGQHPWDRTERERERQRVRETEILIFHKTLFDIFWN